MTADGDIGTKVSVLATVDSGAEKTMVRRSVAEGLGLQPTGEVEVYHFAGPSKTLSYYALIACDCNPLDWRPVHIVDDGGADHPADISFPELLIGRDLMRFMSIGAHGPTGEWSLEIHLEEWPDTVPVPA